MRKLRARLLILVPILLLLGGCSLASPPDNPATGGAATRERAGSLAAPPVPTRPPLPERTAQVTIPAPAVTIPAWVALPTPTPSTYVPLVPTPTPLRTLPSPTPAPTATPADYDAWRPHSYRARGSFVTTTTFPDGATTRQQGEFEIAIVATGSVYETDEFYRLVSVREDGRSDTIVVYQIGGFILVNLGGGHWQVTPRGQGSPFVESMSAVTQLPDAFRDGLAEAEVVGQSELAGVPATYYRFADAAAWADRFISPGSDPGAVVESATFEGWYAGRAGFALKYVFTSSLAGARTLDAEFRETLADQSVAWTYEVYDVETPVAIGWPADAPEPGTIQPPGFALGQFPAPPDALPAYDERGTVELLTALHPDAAADFYRRELDRLGWTMEGNFGLYAVRKEDVTFTLVLSPDAESGGTRISVLVEE